MTSNDIRQAEDRDDGLPWSVGDVAHDPHAENMPDGVILVDVDGDAWQLDDGDWYVTGQRGPINPHSICGPYEVLWLPKEDA